MPGRIPPLQPGPPDRLTAMRLALLTYAVPLTILIMALLYSTRLFIVQQDEALLLDSAAHPARAILAAFRSGLSWQATSPFYVLGLHVWLRLIGGNFFWLRIPSALFYLAGLFMLARAAHYWGKEQSATMLLLLAAFWPYGFHYGPLLTSYSFAFMLIAALTWAYLSFQASRARKTWYAFCVLGLAVLYLTAVGWAVLILLCVDDVLRRRRLEASPSSGTSSDASPGAAPRWLATFAFLAAGYAPLWPGLLRALRHAAIGHARSLSYWRALGLNAIYRVYVLPAGESIAPWFWRFGVPVMLAVLACLVLVWLSSTAELRRFLVFAGLLLVVMDLAGILRSEELMLAAPWFLLPLAVSFSLIENRYKRRGLLISLLVIAGLAWFGIYDRNYYATGAFYEPWPSVAAGSAVAIREGGGVIGNSPQLFFYLTYSLQLPPAEHWRYVGSLPETVRDPHVWDPAEWEAAGRPLRPYMLWVRSNTSDDTPGIEAAAQHMDQHCGGRLNRYLARDPAYPWGQRLLPQTASGSPWLIETHQYTCEEQPVQPSATPVPAPPTSAPAAPGR